MRYLSTSFPVVLPRVAPFLSGLAVALVASFPNTSLHAQESVAPSSSLNKLSVAQNDYETLTRDSVLRYLALSTTFLHDREFAAQHPADETTATQPLPVQWIQTPKSNWEMGYWHLGEVPDRTTGRVLAAYAPQNVGNLRQLAISSIAPKLANSNSQPAFPNTSLDNTTKVAPKTLVATTPTPRLSRPAVAHTASAISSPRLEERHGSTTLLAAELSRQTLRSAAPGLHRVAVPEATARPVRLASRALTPPMLSTRTTQNTAPEIQTPKTVGAIVSLPTPTAVASPTATKNTVAPVAPNNGTPKAPVRVAALPNLTASGANNSNVTVANKPAITRKDARDTATRPIVDASVQARKTQEAQRERDRVLLAQLDKDLMRAERRLKSARAELDEGARALGAFTNTLQGAMLEAGPDAQGLHPFVRTAQRYAGTPYVWGGESARGFDCSGFIIRVMRDLGYRALPHSAAEQFNYGTPVAKALLKPGDLVFFANTYKPGISHVGIWLGRGRFIHAAGTGKGTIVSYLSASPYAEKYAGARRLVSKR